ncbi:MAG: RNA polymerase factor sigma-54 [Clostridiales bacterium]|nr:RNA polymerase factor sigma-54 [Clostridiales bacterium]
MELNLNTVQKLTLAHRMVLSAQILQMSSLELNDYLKELSENNPLVEYKEKSASETDFNIIAKKLDWLGSSDEQNKYYYNEDKEDENDKWNFSPEQNESLEEHLLAQINTQRLEKSVRAAAIFAAKSLDENGYLAETADSIVSLTGIEKISVEAGIRLLKTLDPIGVGASDLKECLLLQLLSEDIPDTTAVAIVENCLELLAKNSLKTIARKLEKPLEKVVKSALKIKSLNPKPSRGFSSDNNLEYITPDAYIYKSPYGNYEIRLNDYYSPSIKINGYYKSIIKNSDSNEAKEYVNEKLSQAQWVIKCINKRNSTLMSTLELILEMQMPFFEKGIGNLLPMKLADIAERLDIHESTVSRAVRDKYIQCSWGIFPMNYFFSSAVHKTDCSDADISRENVKLRIKEIISAEDKHKPLSDREITAILEKENIRISRRTVTKYRESLGIAGTGMRKSY